MHKGYSAICYDPSCFSVRLYLQPMIFKGFPLRHFDSWIFKKTFFSRIMARNMNSQYANKVQLTVSHVCTCIVNGLIFHILSVHYDNDSVGASASVVQSHSIAYTWHSNPLS